VKDSLELLRIARVILNFEYQERRQQMHDRWLEESNKIWREGGSFVPYPNTPLFPAESEVVDMARALKKFLDSRNNTVESPAEESKVPVAPPELPPAMEQARPVVPVFPMEPIETDPDRVEQITKKVTEVPIDDVEEVEVKKESI